MTAAELNAHRVGQCLRAASVAIQDATRAIADLAIAIAPLVPRTFDTLAAVATRFVALEGGVPSSVRTVSVPLRGPATPSVSTAATWYT